MRYLGFIKPAHEYGDPPRALQDAMNGYVQEQLASGHVVETGGMAPTSQTIHVKLANSRLSVTDGPFTEAKEVTGGYAIMEYGSKGEAIEGMRTFLELHRTHWPEFEGECELRELYKM
ncbi:MAG: YciI family protein [Chloroflexota bacterium]